MKEDSSVNNKFYKSRGYDQYETLKIFFYNLKEYAEDYQVIVLPHPREDKNKLQKFCDDVQPYIKYLILDNKYSKNILPASFGIAGMASTLLHESWLMGYPVVSIQLDLRIKSLKAIAEREGVFFINDKTQFKKTLIQWLNKCIKMNNEGLKPNKELLFHENSLKKIEEVLNI